MKNEIRMATEKQVALLNSLFTEKQYIHEGGYRTSAEVGMNDNLKGCDFSKLTIQAASDLISKEIDMFRYLTHYDWNDCEKLSAIEDAYAKELKNPDRKYVVVGEVEIASATPVGTDDLTVKIGLLRGLEKLTYNVTFNYDGELIVHNSDEDDAAQICNAAEEMQAEQTEEWECEGHEDWYGEESGAYLEDRAEVECYGWGGDY